MMRFERINGSNMDKPMYDIGSWHIRADDIATFGGYSVLKIPRQVQLIPLPHVAVGNADFRSLKSFQRLLTRSVAIIVPQINIHEGKKEVVVHGRDSQIAKLLSLAFHAWHGAARVRFLTTTQGEWIESQRKSAVVLVADKGKFIKFL